MRSHSCSWGQRPPRHSPQVPAGGEFQVNSSTAGLRVHGRVASDPGGSFVVVWSSHFADIPLARGEADQAVGRSRSTGSSVDAMTLLATPRGPEFQVNAGVQLGHRSRAPPARTGGASSSRGRASRTVATHGVFAQRYDASGLPRGRRVPGQHLHDRQTVRSACGLGPRGQLRRGLDELRAGRDLERSLCAALRRVGHTARVRVPRQHLHAWPPDDQRRRRPTPPATSSSCGRAPGSGRKRSRRLRAALRRFRSAARFRVPGQHLHDGLAGAPAVASDAAGNSVVAWMSTSQVDPTVGSIRAALRRRRARRGARSSGSTRSRSALRSAPSVASDAARRLLVVGMARSGRPAACRIFAPAL